jgi:hypothetical protein
MMPAKLRTFFLKWAPAVSITMSAAGQQQCVHSYSNELQQIAANIRFTVVARQIMAIACMWCHVAEQH